MLLEKTLETLLDCKEIQPVHSKGNQSWTFIGRTDAEAETLILWPPDGKNWLLKRPWCWERLKVGGEGDTRGWDGWMASPTRVWASPGSWWWTGKPGVLQSRVAKSRTRLSNRTTITSLQIYSYLTGGFSFSYWITSGLCYTNVPLLTNLFSYFFHSCPLSSSTSLPLPTYSWEGHRLLLLPLLLPWHIS